MQTPLKDIVFEMRSLEPFPGVAARVLELAGKADVVPGDVIELVQTDAGITSKVLKLCNSAYFGFQREIASMHEAGNRLGVTTLVNLVMTSSAGKYFRDYGGASADAQARLWKRSVATAIGARLVAQKHRKTDPEQAYTAGLLENIGTMVLERHMEDARFAIRAVAKSGCTMIEAEKRTLGLHHAEIGARLCTKWGLPDVLVDTIRYHHMPENATVDKPLAATSHLAEILTDRALTLLSPEESDLELTYDLSPSALQLTGLREPDFPPLIERLTQELERAKEFLDR
ncbi:MAG: HDOD domain-containing protein [Planctomycetota bacterium]